MQYICELEKCCGCKACMNICPKQAIKMEMNEKGFEYPKINQELCINCGLCKKVCPVNTPKKLNTPIKVYACKNKNQTVRGSSSSGGVFEEICKEILNENGIVYGAIFNSDNIVEHGKAETLEELEKIKKSKYVQSNMKKVYLKVREDLKLNKKVLFSGTPCQVEAIDNSNVINKENLFLVDVVCHGVPSPKIFEEYKNYLEEKYESKIINVNFRFKNEKSTQNIKIDFENGESYISNVSEGDYFYKLFLEDIILRDSCYECKYKEFERYGDISLADFWGYEKGSAKNFGDNKGISLVLVNSEKGMRMFDKIKNNIDYMEVSKEECYPYNCFSNFSKPERYDRIWKDYLENGFKETVKKYY